MHGGSWHCTEGSDQDHPQEKEMQKGRMLPYSRSSLVIYFRYSSVYMSSPHSQSIPPPTLPCTSFLFLILTHLWALSPHRDLISFLAGLTSDLIGSACLAVMALFLILYGLFHWHFASPWNSLYIPDPQKLTSPKLVKACISQMQEKNKVRSQQICWPRIFLILEQERETIPSNNYVCVC